MTGEVLRQYTEAGINERLHLFLQFPDLRRSFQEINRKDLAYHKASISLREGHNKAKYSYAPSYNSILMNSIATSD